MIKYAIGIADRSSTPDKPIMGSTRVVFTVNPYSWDEGNPGGMIVEPVLSTAYLSQNREYSNIITLKWMEVSEAELTLCDTILNSSQTITVRDDQGYIWEASVVPGSYKYARKQSTPTKTKHYTMEVSFSRYGAGQYCSTIYDNTIFAESGGYAYKYDIENGTLSQISSSLLKGYYIQKIGFDKYVASATSLAAGACDTGYIFLADGTLKAYFDFTGVGSSSYSVYAVYEIGDYYYFVRAHYGGNYFYVFRAPNTLNNIGYSDCTTLMSGLVTLPYTATAFCDAIVTDTTVIIAAACATSEVGVIYDHDGNVIDTLEASASSSANVSISLYDNILYIRNNTHIIRYDVDNLEVLNEITTASADSYTRSWGTTYGPTTGILALNRYYCLYTSGVDEIKVAYFSEDDEVIAYDEDWTNENVGTYSSLRYWGRASKNTLIFSNDNVALSISKGNINEQESDSTLSFSSLYYHIPVNRIIYSDSDFTYYESLIS